MTTSTEKKKTPAVLGANGSISCHGEAACLPTQPKSSRNLAGMLMRKWTTTSSWSMSDDGNVVLGDAPVDSFKLNPVAQPLQVFNTSCVNSLCALAVNRPPLKPGPVAPAAVGPPSYGHLGQRGPRVVAAGEQHQGPPDPAGCRSCDDVIREEPAGVASHDQGVCRQLQRREA